MADFGMTEDMYGTNYFRRNEEVSERVPIKWMAPESIERSVYTEKTDVVSVNYLYNWIHMENFKLLSKSILTIVCFDPSEGPSLYVKLLFDIYLILMYH